MLRASLDPPNDGVQQPKGMLGVGVPAGVAMDILPGEGGTNTAWVLVGGTLHTANLETGMLTAAGPVTGLPQAELLDIAAMR